MCVSLGEEGLPASEQILSRPHPPPSNKYAHMYIQYCYTVHACTCILQ